MIDSIRFNDSRLEELVDKLSPKFKNFQKNLDQTSADIRSLEKWLQSCGICFYADIALSNDECIAWSNEFGEWRLVYETTNGLEPSDSTPLIETVVRIRLRAKPLLPKLLSKIAELVPDEVSPVQKPGRPSLFQTKAQQSKKTEEQERIDIFAGIDETDLAGEV